MNAEAELTKDEREVLYEYRQLKRVGHGDMGVELSVKDGTLVRLWTTTKRDLGSLKDGKLREVGE